MSVHLEESFNSVTTNYSSLDNDDSNKLQSSKCCICISSSRIRFLALFFIVVAVFLYAVNFDLPGSLENVIESTFSVSPYEYEYMYSVYSLPNIIMCLFSGLLIDRIFGLLLGSVMFGVIALSGQVIITAGGFIELYWLMLVGRFVIGLGSETVYVCLNCYTVLWFKGKELNFVYGLFMSVLRLGGSFVFLISVPLYNHMQKVVPEKLIFGMTILPFMGMVVVLLATLLALGYMSKKYIMSASKSQYTEGSVELKQILGFPLTFWLILLMLSICINSVSGFVTISQQFLQMKYDLSHEDASFVSSAFNLISSVVSPFPGLLVDQVGRDMYFNMIGLILGSVSQIIMCFTSWNVWIPLTMYSIFFSMLNSCGWPLIARVVEPYQLATAYGMVQCSINLVSTGYNILAGLSMEKCGASGASLLFLGSLLTGIILCLTVWLLDRRSSGTLNQSAAERKLLQSLDTVNSNPVDQLSLASL